MLKRVLSLMLCAVLIITGVMGSTTLSKAAEPQSSTLRVHYTFDGQEVNTADSTDNHLNADSYGTMEVSEDGVFGEALLLKGGYLQMPDTILEGCTDASISIWVNPQRVLASQRLWDIGFNIENFWNLFAPLDESGFKYASALRILNGSKRIPATTATFKTNQWKNIVVTFSESATGTIKIYEDGVLIGTGTTGKKISDLGKVTRAYIGRAQFGVDPDFYGYIDDFRIYGEALSDAAVQGLYQAGETELVNQAADSIDLGLKNGITNLDRVSKDLLLTTTSDLVPAGTSISWETSDDTVISSTGVIGEVTQDSDATLTATITRGLTSVTRAIPVTVVKETAYAADTVPSVTTTPGDKPLLPELITANGGSISLDVTWDEIQPSEYASVGIFEVNGTVTDTDESVTIAVVVDDTYINNPIIQQGSAGGAPDPYIAYDNGYYYYVRHDFNTGITVSKAKRLQDIGSAPRIVVYRAPETGMYSKEYWAPELIKVDGNWYIYVAADDGNNVNHRMYVLECTDPTNPQAEYLMKGKIAPTIQDGNGDWVIDSTQDKWGIDGTVIPDVNGTNYYVWSGWPGDTDGQQNIYIAEMLNPYTLKGSRVLINQPDTAWEHKGVVESGGLLVNEGPQIVKHNGKVLIVYSANFSGGDWYSLASLTADETSDLLSKASWTKSKGPLFTQSLDPKDQSYGTGHAMITTSPDGTEEYLIYHAFQTSGGGWLDRSARALKMSWNGDVPVFGNPISIDELIKEASGTPQVIVGKYEAEEAKLSGVASTANEKRASAGKIVNNITTGASVTFDVYAPKSGEYLISLMGNARVTTDTCLQNVSINGTDYTVSHSGINNAAGIVRPSNDVNAEVVGDGLYANLTEGMNTIVVTMDATSSGAADLDYLYIILEHEQVVETPSAIIMEQKTAALEVGDSLQLNASVYPDTAPDKTMTWESDNETVATVNQSGQVEALQKGSAKITVKLVSDNTVTASCNVTVTEPKVQIKMEAENATFAGVAKAVDRSDASGGKKVGYIDNASATVTFSLEADVAGTYRIDLTAGSGTDMPNASHQYYVNGDTANAKTIKYSPNGWDNWGKYPVEVQLNKGINTFTVTHSGQASSFSELDYIVFYTSNPKVENLLIDDVALENFNTYVLDYDVDVESLETLPMLTGQYASTVLDNYNLNVTQATTKNPVATLTLQSKTDSRFSITYTVNFFDKNAFSNPIVNYGADPFVTYEDGYYYYCRVLQDKAIYVSRSPELNRIAQTEPYMVYQPSGTDPTGELWAPELHFVDGKWYIYYTAGAGNNHRMYVLESKTSDALGEFAFKGKVTPTTDRWGIDQTVLEYNDQLYAIWSGWEGTENVEQRIYIAKMSNPWTISGERVQLSRPEYAWELDGTPRINEGPQVVTSPEGIVNVLFSASGSWTDNYCLGQLTLKEDGDPMNASDWTKGTKAVFSKNAPSTYSTGHACFTVSPDGTESYIVYHATRGAGQSWNGRGVRTQKFTWNADGTPNFGKAIAYEGKVNLPSGTQVIDRSRYEAEDGILTGATVAATYNSSAGEKVTGISASGAGITFNVTATKAGSYKLYIGAATRAADVRMDVKVNNAASIVKKVYPFNAANASGLCPDNWMGYELTVDLVAGENTIIIGKSASYTAPDVDYIELEFLKDAAVIVDKTSLQLVYDQNKGKVETDYEATSWATFATALLNATTVLNDAEATQVEVDQAKAALQDAAEKLVENVEAADKLSLQVLYDQYKGKVEADYETASWANFETALSNATTVLNDTEATQVEVDQAKATLQDAVEKLVKKVEPADKLSLQVLYDQNKGKVEANYEAASWTALVSALSKATTILNKAEATQTEVDQAKAALQDAIQKLVIKPKTIAVSSVVLKDTEISLVKNGTYNLLATVAPENATNKKLTWTSSNTSVVVVDANGTVTAVGSGTVVVTAKAADGSNFSASCKVNVSYSVNYVLNGGKNATANPANYFGTEITLKAPIKAGYTFAGWYTNSSFANKITSLKSSDYVLYAKWQKVSVAKSVIKTFKSSKKKQVSLKLKSKISGASGYEITYALDSKFKKSKKTVTVKVISKTISKLKSKKTYYVKVRAYKLDSAGKKVYGKYSSVKKAKIK